MAAVATTVHNRLTKVEFGNALAMMKVEFAEAIL